MSLQAEGKNLDTQADELVELLDSLVKTGSGHINLQVGEDTVVQTVKSNDCGMGNMACHIPNLSSEDDEDDEF